MEYDPNGIPLHEPGAKADGGKVRAGLLADFSLALMEVAKVCTEGAAKYSDGGWQFVKNGQQRYFDAKWRHLLERRHTPVNPDFALKTLAHEAWNVLAELELLLRKEKGYECARGDGDSESERPHQPSG